MGLLIGTLDLGYACVFWAIRAGIAPGRIFQSVASGLLGRAAFDGGWPTILLGGLLQLFIATCIAGVYVLAARSLPLLWRRPWICGPLYGLGVYGVMNYVVVPLSAAAKGSAYVPWIVLSILVHMGLIGLPAALGARRVFAPPGSATPASTAA